jgi:hypothetical protein
MENIECPVCKKPIDGSKVFGGEVGTVTVTYGEGSFPNMKITDKIYYVHLTGYPSCRKRFDAGLDEKESEVFMCGRGKEWDRLEAEEYKEIHRDDPKPQGVGL